MGLATYAGQVALEGLASDDAARVVDGLAQALDSAHCDSAVTGQRTVTWSGDLFFRSGSGLNRQLYGGVLDIVESQPLAVRYSAKAGWLGDTLRFGVPYTLAALVLWLISRDIVWSVSFAVLFTVFSVIEIQRQRRDRLPLTIRRMALDWRDREYQVRVDGERLQDDSVWRRMRACIYPATLEGPVEPEVLAESERDRIELERRHRAIRRLQPVALAVGGVLAFLFGGIPGLVAVLLVLAVTCFVAQP